MRASRFELAVAHPSPHLKRMLLPLTPAMRDPDCHQRSPRLLATVHIIRIHLLQTLLCLSIGLGSALAAGTGLDEDPRETLFAAGLKDVRPADVEQVEALILDTLRDLVATNSLRLFEAFESWRSMAMNHQEEF